MCLSVCERLFGSKIPEVGMIGEDLCQVGVALKVMAEVTECMDNN